MIINNNKNFAFIHIQKTAGSSISSVLSKINGSQFSNVHDFIINLNSPEKYFKFAFVRNPWDRLYSWYNMMICKGKHNSFSKYLLDNSSNFSQFLDCTEIIEEKEDKVIKNKLIISNNLYYKSLSFNQLDYILDKNGNVMADFVGKFENLNQDFNYVMSVIKENKYTLPHINKFRHDNYRKYYTDKDVEKVAKLYKRDIEYFKYSF